MYRGLVAPNIMTSRLVIKLISLADAYDMNYYSKDSRVTQFLTFNPHSSMSVTKSVIKNMLGSYYAGESIVFSIFYKENRKMIGSISLTFKPDKNIAELGYVLSYDYWNMGIMSEAIKEIVKVAFEYYGVFAIYVSHVLENYSSKRVIEKNGFIFDRIVSNGIIIHGIKRDLVSYHMNINEYYDHIKNNDLKR